MTQFINIMIFILGSSIGSFLNVLIDRLPNDKKITGRSSCDHCHKIIKWYDLIPVISFLLLRAKSRCCKKKISLQYPIVELTTGLVFLIVFNQLAITVNNLDFIKLLALWGLVSCLIVIFVSDSKYHLISDYMLIGLLVFSILFNLSTFTSWSLLINSCFSALLVGLPIFLIYYISHEKAMGLGDVYLSFIIGFLLGWSKGLIALYIAFVLGAIVGSFLLIIHKKKIKSKIAFGPFIAIGTMLMIGWGNQLIEVIKRIYGL